MFSNALGSTQTNIFIVIFTIIFFLCSFHIFPTGQFIQQSLSPTKKDFFWRTRDPPSCGGEEMAFPYFENSQFSGYGKPFKCSLLPYLEKFQLSKQPSTERKMEEKESDIVIVTYSSANHYLEARAGLHNIRKTVPNKIVFFDLGLNEIQVREVRSLCNVEYVKVDLSIYPKHVQTLHSYAFKAVVIAESYRRFAAFWVFDASIRIGDVEKFNNFPQAVGQGEVADYAMTSVANQSNYGMTHPGMYNFLPASQKDKQRRQLRSGLVFVVRSPLSNDVIKWHLLCALTESCINPPGHQKNCQFSNNTDVYFGCHRYDQSAVNLILFSAVERFGPGGQLESNNHDFSHFLEVHRAEEYNGELLSLCSERNNLFSPT